MKARMKHLLLPAAMALLALVACSDKDHDGTDTDDRTPISITAAVITGNSYSSSVYRGGGSRRLTEESSPATRATDNAWQATDAIGIILLQSGTATPVEGNPTAARYVTPTANGRFSPADEANTAYYPTQGEEADVLAFYPYRELGADLMIPVSTASQTALSQIDLMVADKSPSHSATKPDVSLAFSHKLVKLVITVDREAFAADVDLNGATVVLQGTATTARWSLTGEKLIKDEASKADISLPMTYDATASASGTAAGQTLPGRLSGTAIVLPTAADAGVKLVITTAAGQAFDAPLSAGTALVPGTVNTLRVHLRQTGVAINATVIDWGTGITADQSIRIDGLTDGSGKDEIALAAAQGDMLRLTYLADGAAEGTASLAATYLYTAGAWTCDAPLYWDHLQQTGTPCNFAALFTPAATPAGDNERDYLSGTATTPFGTSPAFMLKHSLARIELQLTATGFTATELAAARVSLDAVQPLATIAPDGVTTTDANTTRPRTLSVDKAGERFSLILAPQSFTTGSRLATIAVTGHTYGVSTPAGMKAEAGKTTVLKITLSKSAISGISVSTTDWTTGEEHTGDAGYDD